MEARGRTLERDCGRGDGDLVPDLAVAIMGRDYYSAGRLFIFPERMGGLFRAGVEVVLLPLRVMKRQKSV